MAGIGRVVEIVPLVPEAKLKVEPAARRFAADELEGVEVLLPLGLGHAIHADRVVRQVDEERIGEVEVDVAQDVVVVGIVVADAEVDRDAVEAIGRQHVEVPDPPRLVVEPRLVLDLAAESAGHRTNARRGLLDQRQRAEEFPRPIEETVGELGDRIAKRTTVKSPRDDVIAGAKERKGLGQARQRNAGSLRILISIVPGGDANDPRGATLANELDVPLSERAFEQPKRPLDGFVARVGVGAVVETDAFR